MKRRDFFAAAMSTAVAIPSIRHGEAPEFLSLTDPFIPPYLRPGDLIGICCPAGSITCDEIQPAVRELENWGFRTQAGATIGKKDFTFRGTDEERLADF